MILVIGDIILDEYWFGSSNRLSPEAVVPIVHINKKETRLGGAGNVANNIRSLGSDVHLITCFGNDDKGEILINLLKDNSIKYTNLNKDKKTNTKIRIISDNNQIVRIDNDNIEKKIFSKIIFKSKILKNLDKFDLIIISDYDKGIVENNFKKLLHKANQKKIPILIDPKSNDISRYRKCTLITPNLKELKKLAFDYEDNLNFIKKIRKMLKDNQIENILITLGKEGMHFINANENFKLKSINQEVFDVSGAGDTVISSIAIFLKMGFNFIESIKMSNVAAGLVVKKIGTSTTSIDEIYSFMINQNDDYKFIKDKKYLATLINSLKKNSKKIVMTNGCFDLIHAGHIKLLKDSKKLGDFLIVAINTDSSIRNLKGHNRPINKLIDRIEVIKSLTFVDLILTFESETPIDLYKMILPEILTKGSDYKLKQIVGAKEIISNGGKVKRINIYKKLSTTNILKKI